MTLRVALLVPSNLKQVDGNTVRARGILRIVGGRYRSVVLTGRGEGDAARGSEEGLPTVRFFTLEKDSFVNPLKLMIINLRLVQVLLRGRFDLVYAQGLLLVPGLFVGTRLAGSKLMFEAHSLAYRERAQVSKLQPLLLYPLEAFAGRVSAAVVALSGETVRFYRKMNGRVHYVPVFVDSRLFRPTERPHNGDGRKVGLVGPFEGIFNGGQVDFLLQNLQDFNHRIQFVLLGRMKEQPTAENVLVRGFLPDDKYALELASLDALLVPVRVGTFGPKNKVLEAMSSGVPVFSTPEGILGLDYADPGENMFVAPLGRMVQAVNSTLFETERIQEVGAKARKTVEEHYSLDKCAEEILEAIREVISRD